MRTKKADRIRNILRVDGCLLIHQLQRRFEGKLDFYQAKAFLETEARKGNVVVHEIGGYTFYGLKECDSNSPEDIAQGGTE